MIAWSFISITSLTMANQQFNAVINNKSTINTIENHRLLHLKSVQSAAIILG